LVQIVTFILTFLLRRFSLLGCLYFCLGLFRPSVASVNMTADAAASCDPDYGWINGPEGSNKCYMVLRVRREAMVIDVVDPST